MASEYYQKHKIPEDFPLILRNFTREVLRLQPKNIVEFSAKYFRALANKTQFTWDETKSRGPLPCDYPRVNIQKNLKEVATSKQPVPYVPKKPANEKTGQSHETQPKNQKQDEIKTKQQTEHHDHKVTTEEKKVAHDDKTVNHEDQTRHPAPKHSHRSSEDHAVNQSLNISGNMSLPSNPDEAAEAYVGKLIELSEAALVRT